MLIKNECIVCVLNQIIRVSDFLGLKKKKADEVFGESLKETVRTNYLDMTPPVFSGNLYKKLSEITGIDDPYKNLRKEQNDLVLDNIKFFRDRIGNSENPLFTAFVYSLLGNIIDYGGVEIFDVNQIFEEINDIKLMVNDYGKIEEKLGSAEMLLIISDNAGEAVFDMLLIEQIRMKYPRIKIRYGVRSGPAINDILKEDAEYIGIGEIAEIIETGSTYAGTVISASDSDFVKVYEDSDIVISKGQGNFETLEMEKGQNIFFIFKVKCSVVSDHSGLPVNSLVLGYRDSFFL